MDKKYIIILSIFLFVAIASAVEQKLYVNINAMGNSIYNASWVNATYFSQNGSLVLDTSEEYLGGLSCSDSQITSYNSASGEWECIDRPVSNVPLWEDAGTYLVPNSSYAVNVYLPAGFLNISEWLKVYGDAEIFGSLDVHGDANIIGTLTSGDLSTGQGNFSDEVTAKGGINLNGTLNDINSNAKIEYDGGNINFYI